MKRTKKEFMTHYEERYTVIDFYYGKRGSIYSGYGLEKVGEITSRASLRGGFCVVYPFELDNGIRKCVDYIESKRGLGQGICNGTWDTFHVNIEEFI